MDLEVLNSEAEGFIPRILFVYCLVQFLNLLLKLRNILNIYIYITCKNNLKPLYSKQSNVLLKL